MQINSFGFGNADNFEEALENDDSLFPNLWVELATNNGEGTGYTRSINLMVTSVGPNQLELLSDTERILLDVIAALKLNYNEDLYDVGLIYSLEPLLYRGVDHSFGFLASIELEYPNMFDACSIPTSDKGRRLAVWNNIDKNWEEVNVDYDKLEYLDQLES